MKLRIMKFALAFLIGSNVLITTFAGGVEVTPVTVVNPWYFTLGGGYAWSTKANIRVDLRSWDPANEGYNSRLNQSPFVTFGVGRRISNFLLAELTSSYFNDFNYRRAQTSSVASTVGFTGTSRLRFFDLSNFNVMLNLIFNCNRFSFAALGTSISPFIGGGVGAALNTIKNFHTINSEGALTSVGTNSVHDTSLAAQAETGLSFAFSPNMVLDIGYRYYYGGTFHGPSRLFVAGTGVLYGPAWKGSLKANLLFADARFSI